MKSHDRLTETLFEQRKINIENLKKSFEETLDEFTVFDVEKVVSKLNSNNARRLDDPTSQFYQTTKTFSPRIF